MNYKHLAQEERYQIHALKRQNISLARIAAELQRDRSIDIRDLRPLAPPAWEERRDNPRLYGKFQTAVITKCPS